MTSKLRSTFHSLTGTLSYLPLPQKAENGDSKEADGRNGKIQVAPISLLILGFSVLFFWTLALISATWSSFRHGDYLSEHSLQMYSPLQHLVEYQHTVFNQGVYNESTVYMGTPRKESNEAWNAITEHGMIKMDFSEEKRLYNHTVRIMDDKDYFVGAVEVFHQLHCLKLIRDHIWAEQPTVFYLRENQGIDEVEHMDHCLDYLRQVLMCHGDIGIITFRYGKNGRSYKPNFNVTRTCRKFEPLAQWSDLHQAGNATPDGNEDD